MNRGAVFVTGGAKRIGNAICLELAKRGHPIVIHYHNSQNEALELADKCHSYGVLAITIKANLEKLDEVEGLIEKAASSIGQIKVLLNCASHFQHDNIDHIDGALFSKSLSINLLSPMSLSSQFFKHIKSFNEIDAEHTSIINLLDQKIASPNGDHLSYTLSRLSLYGLTEILARECAPWVRVNAVAPGFTLPSANMTDAHFNAAQQRSPLNYGPKPSDIAEAVAYLISARSVTGQTIFVDSGERFNARRRDVEFDREGV